MSTAPPAAAGARAAHQRTQAVYYRDRNGREPVRQWLEALFKARPEAAAKILGSVAEHLNGRGPADPPPAFPRTSQIDGGLRELRVGHAATRYRLLYQRSGNLLILLHAFEKHTAAVPAADVRIAQQRFADFRVRMDADHRIRPRAAGLDAPRRHGAER